MNPHQFEIITRADSETRELGLKIGRLLDQGLILTLTGDLGSGKTCFVQGLAKGLDVPDKYVVASPSYTLINEYPGRLKLNHVDLYRIDEPADINDLGLYDLLDDEAVTAIEWAERIPSGSMPEYLSVTFEFLEDSTRRISLTAFGKTTACLLKKLEKI